MLSKERYQTIKRLQKEHGTGMKLLFAVVFAVVLSAAFFVLINSYRHMLKVGDVERITIYCQAFWDEGTGYRGASSVTVYADGRVISESVYSLSGTRDVTVEIPENGYTEARIKTEAFEALINDFNHYGFPGLKDDLSDYGVCDGGNFYIEVVAKDGVYHKGGFNPTNKKFRACYDAVHCLSNMASD